MSYKWDFCTCIIIEVIYNIVSGADLSGMDTVGWLEALKLWYDIGGCHILSSPHIHTLCSGDLGWSGEGGWVEKEGRLTFSLAGLTSISYCIVASHFDGSDFIDCRINQQALVSSHVA